MTPEQFCYWLQGRAELQPSNPPSPEEWQAIREHLATVFNKVTPPIGIPNQYPFPNTTGVPATPFPWRTECKAQGVAQ